MTNEDVLRDRLAAAVDETDRLRAVADRLAKALERCHRSIECETYYTAAEIARKAIAEYRKAVQ